MIFPLWRGKAVGRSSPAGGKCSAERKVPASPAKSGPEQTERMQSSTGEAASRTEPRLHLIQHQQPGLLRLRATVSQSRGGQPKHGPQAPAEPQGCAAVEVYQQCVRVTPVSWPGPAARPAAPAGRCRSAAPRPAQPWTSGPRRATRDLPERKPGRAVAGNHFDRSAPPRFEADCRGALHPAAGAGLHALQHSPANRWLLGRPALLHLRVHLQQPGRIAEPGRCDGIGAPPRYRAAACTATRDRSPPGSRSGADRSCVYIHSLTPTGPKVHTSAVRSASGSTNAEK